MKFTSRRNVVVGAGAIAASFALNARAAQKNAPGGFSAERLARVTQAMQAAIDQGEVDGIATLVFRHGEVAQVNTVGWQDKEAKVAMRRDSIFRIMSMTKPVAAVAAMILVDEGKLKLEVPVAPWLRELAQMKVVKNPADPLDAAAPASRPIRVVDLLTHRSGIAVDARTGPLAVAMREVDAGRAVSGDEWIKRRGAVFLAAEPGAAFAYGSVSNSFDALGILVERAAEMPLAEFLRRRIFEPLGMNDTGYMLPKEKLQRLAAMSSSGTSSPTRGVAGDKMPPFASGAFGLLSTLDDYLKFARMLLGHGTLGNTRIISHRAVEYMTTNYLTPEQRKMPFSNIENFWAGEGFGLGVAVKDNLAIDSAITGVGSPGTFSWPGAYGTWWIVDPKEDMIQIYMVQGGNNVPSRRAFQATVYEALND